MKPLSLIEQFIIEFNTKKIKSHKHLLNFHRSFCKKNKISFFTNNQLLQVYHVLIQEKKIKENKNLENLLVLKSTRSLSGIVVVSVLTKPFPCPGRCLYCPTQSGVPKSYLKNEPAVMRAIMCNYDPYLQTSLRLKALKAIGHPTDKINIRVIGGTWSFYPKNYQTWFLKKVFQAVNEFGQSKKFNNLFLEGQQKFNEKAKCRIVEISIETRQDYVNKFEILRLRKLGVTKVELGVQSLYDDILKANRRGHGIKETILATQMLKDAGFKVSYQVMVNLFSSSVARDKKMLSEIFSNPLFRPDHLKIYPLALVKEAPIYKMYKNKMFKPYSQKQLIEILKFAKTKIPYYCRVERVIRDIPTQSIVEGGAQVSNLRQTVLAEMQKEGKRCKCIRCREIKGNFNKYTKIKLFIEEYEASDGREYFLSLENKSRTKLYSVLRLRIPSGILNCKKHFLPVLQDAAIIREIHTYGPQIAIGQKSPQAAQHRGFGEKLIFEAEKITRDKKIKKIAVISGVGAREYFRKLGFKLDRTYMVKNLLV